ncbi:MAG: hypothetical protein HUU25_12460, partial [Candidatus Sumerlaeia bacterium]|nr:hypothetical protein [Candidatus Sumerlaeia bacterium]
MHRITTALLTAAIAPMAFAQTRTVSSTGPADHTTVQAAIDFFDPDPDGGTPNVINILDSSVYDEVITVDVPVTISGNAAARPTLAVRTNAAAPGANDGLLISIPAGTTNVVVLRSLIVIPSLTTPPADDGIVTVGQNIDLTMENILVTANNGSNAPVTIDGLTQVSLAGATPFGDDGIFLGGTAAPAGTGFVATLRDVVSSHHSEVTGADAGFNDGIVLSAAGLAYTILDGCVFSYNNRLGIQGHGTFTLSAPTRRVQVLGNRGFAGIWFAGGAGARVIDGVDVSGTTGTTNTGNGWGIELQNGGTVTSTAVRNATLANNTGPGLLVGSLAGAGPLTIENVTTANNASEAIDVDAGFTGTIAVTNCVLAGNGTTTNDDNLVNHRGGGTMTISDSAIVTGGPLALSPGTGGTGSIVQTNVTNGDPEFVSAQIDGSADMLDVAAASYAAAGTGGAPLAGGADYVYTLGDTTLSITLDGDASDWTGAAGAAGSLVYDAATQQLIYNDPTGDDLGDGDYTAPTDGAFNDTESDIEEVRLAHDGTYLYILVRTGAYGTGFGADFETAMTGVALNFDDANGPNASDFGAFSDTRLAGALGWDTQFALGETGSGIYSAIGGTFAANANVASGEQSETNAVVEFRVDTTELGAFLGGVETNVIVGQGHSSGGA